jgi:NMT1/THI5 like
MDSLRLLYRDVDRTPYLFTLRHCAGRLGLDLDVVRYDMGRVSAGPTGQEWGELLLSGEVDVIGENYWGLQSYRAAGRPVLCVASVVNVWTEKLMVAPEIGSLEDLRGKRFALRSVGPQALLPKRWLADIGLASSVEVVTYPERDTGRWGHWKKVADGECQACFMTNIYSGMALDAGLRDLPYEPYPFDGGNVTLTTTEATAAGKPDALQALVDATFDATAMFKTQPQAVLAIMREECAGLLAEHFGMLDDARLEWLYEVLRDELADIPVPTPEGISNARRIRLGTAPELDHYNPMVMWELGFARCAMAKRAAAATPA